MVVTETLTETVTLTEREGAGDLEREVVEVPVEEREYAADMLRKGEAVGELVPLSC